MAHEDEEKYKRSASSQHLQGTKLTDKQLEKVFIRKVTIVAASHTIEAHNLHIELYCCLMLAITDGILDTVTTKLLLLWKC